MHILSILLFAVSASSDSLVVGLSYGAKKVGIHFGINVILSLISGLGTYLAMSLGTLFFEFIPASLSNYIGSSILILFGIYLFIHFLIKQSGRKKRKQAYDESELALYENALRNPELIDKNASKTIELKEAIILGLVLCLNNIGLGIGASITGLNLYLTSIASGLFSLVFIPIGYYIGAKLLSDRFSEYSEVISIIMIIGLGIYELLI